MRFTFDNADQARVVFDALNHAFTQHVEEGPNRQHLVAAVVEAHSELLRLRMREGTGLE